MQVLLSPPQTKDDKRLVDVVNDFLNAVYSFIAIRILEKITPRDNMVMLEVLFFVLDS